MMKENRKEFRNRIKLKRGELFQEKCDKNPKILKGKDIVRKIWITLISLRVFVVVLGIIVAVLFPTSNVNIMVEVFSIVAMLVYAMLMMSYGSRSIAFLGLMGSVMSLLPLLNSPVLEIIYAVPIGLKIYIVITIVTAVVQMLAMAYLLMNRNVKDYFEAQLQTMKELDSYILKLKNNDAVQN